MSEELTPEIIEDIVNWDCTSQKEAFEAVAGAAFDCVLRNLPTTDGGRPVPMAERAVLVTSCATYKGVIYQTKLWQAPPPSSTSETAVGVGSGAAAGAAAGAGAAASSTAPAASAVATPANSAPLGRILQVVFALLAWVYLHPRDIGGLSYGVQGKEDEEGWLTWFAHLRNAVSHGQVAEVRENATTGKPYWVSHGARSVPDGARTFLEGGQVRKGDLYLWNMPASGQSNWQCTVRSDVLFSLCTHACLMMSDVADLFTNNRIVTGGDILRTLSSSQFYATHRMDKVERDTTSALPHELRKLHYMWRFPTEVFDFVPPWLISTRDDCAGTGPELPLWHRRLPRAVRRAL